MKANINKKYENLIMRIEYYELDDICTASINVADDEKDVVEDVYGILWG